MLKNEEKQRKEAERNGSHGNHERRLWSLLLESTADCKRPFITNHFPCFPFSSVCSVVPPPRFAVACRGQTHDNHFRTCPAPKTNCRSGVVRIPSGFYVTSRSSSPHDTIAKPGLPLGCRPAWPLSHRILKIMASIGLNWFCCKLPPVRRSSATNRSHWTHLQGRKSSYFDPIGYRL